MGTVPRSEERNPWPGLNRQEWRRAGFKCPYWNKKLNGNFGSISPFTWDKRKSNSRLQQLEDAYQILYEWYLNLWEDSVIFQYSTKWKNYVSFKNKVKFFVHFVVALFVIDHFLLMKIMSDCESWEITKSKRKCFIMAVCSGAGFSGEQIIFPARVQEDNKDLLQRCSQTPAQALRIRSKQAVPPKVHIFPL